MTIVLALRSIEGATLPTDGLQPSLSSINVQMREGIIDLGTITREIRIE